jgi:hypothetical protein
VSDADGADSQAIAPRFQAGQLLRIEDEYLRVLEVDSMGNSLMVLRGVHGTTAAAHAQDTQIEVFQVAPEVETLCLRWAMWLYKEPDRGQVEDTPHSFIMALEGLRRTAVKA